MPLLSLLPVAASWASGIAALAYGLSRSARDTDFRDSLPERFGGGSWQTDDFPTGGTHLWFHAASLGELEGVAPVLKSLHATGDTEEVLITTTSLTGKAMALKRMFSKYVALVPADLPGVVRRIVAKHKPAAFVVFETELWPSLYLEMVRRSVPIVIVNGRISDRTVKRYTALRSFFSPILSKVEHVFAQTSTDAERYLALGIPADRVSVNGVTKFDQMPPEDFAETVREFREQTGIREGQLCFVAGSVRPGEEQIVIDAYVGALQYFPDLKMIIAPRHLEYAPEYVKLLTARELRFQLRSSGSSAGNRQVLILDTLGELKKAYAVGSVSFVGGSLVPIGGHNPLEPAMFGCPVLFGPYNQNVRDISAQLQDRGGLIVVSNAREMEDALVKLCSDDRKRWETGQLASDVWRGNLGASDRVVKFLRGLKAKDTDSEL